MACNAMLLRFIEDGQVEYIKLLLENGMDVNQPIITTGEFAGFTALHVACMKNDPVLVKLLVKDYGADVNATAADGSQPLLLACLYEKCKEYPEWGGPIGTLVNAKANVDIEFGKKILFKHFKDREWYPDFGEKIPLVAYLILNNESDKTLLFKECNINMISRSNKTLLMYLIEKGNIYNTDKLISRSKVSILMENLINHRDDDDVPLSHYPLHPKKFGNFRCHTDTLFETNSVTFDYELLRHGIDKYALINNDPATFLPNLAAYRCAPSMLELFLPYYTSMPLSRILHYATLPIDENSDNLIYLGPLNRKSKQIEKKCIEIALKDLVFRRAIKSPVPKEEIELMDKLISSDKNISNIVRNYKKKITGIYSLNVEFGNKKMKMSDFLMLAYDDKKIKLLAQGESSLDDFFEDYKLNLDKNGMDVNQPIITTGEFAGFTALHVACMKNGPVLVKLLVKDYGADVNATAADGSQPLLLACLYEKCKEYPEWGGPIGTLVNAKANVDIEFGKKILFKHFKDREWYPDFGEKIPLIAYLILNNELDKTLLFKECNINMISRSNKTLLMYLMEKGDIYNTERFILRCEVSIWMEKLINHRDDDDVPLSHYTLHPKKFGNFRWNKYTVFDTIFETDIDCFDYELIKHGADKCALINNDPATFLPNLAAYRCSPKMLKLFLPYYTSMPLSRILYYATLPIDENSDNLIYLDPEINNRSHYLKNIKKIRNECIEIALKDLVFRRAIKLPVPKEEIELMDKLISSDKNISNIVSNYKKRISDIYFVNIELGDKKIKMSDFLMLAYNDKKVKLLAQEESSLDAFSDGYRRLDRDNNFDDYFQAPVFGRVIYARKRLKHLENLKKVSSLREAIPLPYEVVLEIVEYLNNLHLDMFIKAFYSL
ncbi:Protein of unknown function [Cotesia congregata]|uniref:Uncharacterized protein n=1 Tax=Cotesia congregata TaxID=51543 RepID=A0A8J2MGN7_COTCN|nr:Protein of unknown function [Cotesia congregata]